MFTWIVDDDQVRGAENHGVFERDEVRLQDIPARRDGLINSLRTTCSLSGAIWAGVFQVMLGILGYEGERFNKGEHQPAEVRVLLEVLFIIIVPGFFIVFAIPMLFFPLRGEQLQNLNIKYARLYDKLASAKSTSVPVGS